MDGAKKTKTRAPHRNQLRRKKDQKEDGEEIFHPSQRALAPETQPLHHPLVTQCPAKIPLLLSGPRVKHPKNEPFNRPIFYSIGVGSFLKVSEILGA